MLEQDVALFVIEVRGQLLQLIRTWPGQVEVDGGDITHVRSPRNRRVRAAPISAARVR